MKRYWDRKVSEWRIRQNSAHGIQSSTWRSSLKRKMKVGREWIVGLETHYSLLTGRKDWDRNVWKEFPNSYISRRLDNPRKEFGRTLSSLLYPMKSFSKLEFPLKASFGRDWSWLLVRCLKDHKPGIVERKHVQNANACRVSLISSTRNNGRYFKQQKEREKGKIYIKNIEARLLVRKQWRKFKTTKRWNLHKTFEVQASSLTLLSLI